MKTVKWLNGKCYFKILQKDGDILYEKINTKKMKTAIEQMMIDLEESLFGNSKLTTKEIWDKALEAEKQQIIEAHGNKLKKSSGATNYEYWFSGEDYYNKTFKK